MLDLSNRKLMVNTFYKLAGKVLPLVVGIIIIPIFIHKIGVERFGFLTIVWAIIGYFGIVDLGVGRATTKFVSEYLVLNKLKELPALVISSLVLYWPVLVNLLSFIAKDEDFSYALLLPLGSGYIVYHKKRKLSEGKLGKRCPQNHFLTAVAKVAA